MKSFKAAELPSSDAPTVPVAFSEAGTTISSTGGTSAGGISTAGNSADGGTSTGGGSMS